MATGEVMLARRGCRLPATSALARCKEAKAFESQVYLYMTRAGKYIWSLRSE